MMSSGRLTPEIIATNAEPGLAWIQKELGDWPTDSCSDTCSSIIDCLYQNLPDWKFSIVRGYFALDVANEHYRAHTWLAGKLRGKTHFVDPVVVVDPTAGQFLSGGAIRVFYEGEEDYWRYLPGMRLPSFQRDGSRLLLKEKKSS
jgi:hypothetical protein